MNAIGYVIETVDFERVRKLFVALAAVCLILIIPNAIWIYSQRPKKIPKEAIVALKTDQVEPLSSYLQIFDRSTLFGNAASAGSMPVLQASAVELIKDYRLKGVILGGEAEAIVEDVKTQKTSFIKIGDQVGDLTVKEIKEGMIVLSYFGGEAKLEIQ